MQGNHDSSWSLGTSGNGGYTPQATRVFSNFNVQRPIRYNFQTQQTHSFPFGSAGANVQVMRIDNLVYKALQSLVSAGENVSSTRVSQSVLAQLQTDSWRSLGIQMQDVPSLRKLMALEGKHPLVLLYFPSISSSTGPVQITSEEIISFLDSYLNTCDMDGVKLDEFLNFVAEKKSVTSKGKLGVRIQSLRMYVSFIQDAKRQEGETLKILLTELHQKYHILSSKKQLQEKSLTVSEHHKVYCGKHTRFCSPSSDDNDSADYGVENDNSCDHFSSFPDPSVAEEMKQSSNKKRKAESRNLEKSDLSKLLRRGTSKIRRGHVKQEIPKSVDDSDAKQVFSVNEADFTLSEGALRLFISTWKDTCKELSMSMKELVTEAIEEQIRIEIIDTNLVVGYSTAGTSSGANKPNPLCPTPMKSGSMSGNLVHEWNSSISTDFSVRDQLHTNTPWAAQAQQTGKKGEEIAYRYFAAKYGKEAVVRWVNEQSETGLPYDLIIENRRGGKKEYVEVKTTVSTQKDYLNLTVREWQFANEKGESYIIAHVLLGNSNAILTQHRNLVKLCQEGHLRLLIFMPNQRKQVNFAF